MIRSVYPGASYGKELVGGTFARLYKGSHFETHRGRLEFPADEPLGVIQFDITNVGGFHLAGQSWTHKNRIYEYSDVTGKWTHRDGHDGEFASPVVYDVHGVLHVAPVVASDGSLSAHGYRYADETGVYGWDETFAAYGLTDYFKLRDLMIGSSQNGGILARSDRDGIVRAFPESGDCVFMQGDTDGSRFVLYVWKWLEDCAVTYRGTLDEPRNLPPLVAAPSPPPVPVPQPKPEPVPMSVPNKLYLVQTVRTTYPTPLGDRHGQFLIDVARATGAKLLRKDAGSHVTLPDGRNVSQDILVFSNGQECFDILSDAEGAASPAWQEKGAIAGEYYDVSAAPAPPPDSGTTLPNPGTGDLDERVRELEATVAQLVAWTRGV